MTRFMSLTHLFLASLLMLGLPAAVCAYTDRNVPDHVGDSADMDDTVSVVIGAQTDVLDIDGLFTSRDSTTKIFYGQYDDSGAAWGTTTTAITMTNAKVYLGAHLYEATKPFYSQSDNTYYVWIMYLLARPTTCDSVMEGGFIYVSYSANFTTWTTPTIVRGSSAAGLKAWDCAGGNMGIAAAGLGAFLHNGNIYLIYSQGELTTLEGVGNTPRTNLVMLKSSPHRSSHFDHPLVAGGAPLSGGLGFGTQPASLVGLFNADFDDIRQPSAFRRLGVAYDTVTGHLWIARAYAWPDGTNAGVPCGQVGCMNGVQLETSRVQLLTVNIGNPIDPALFYNGAVTTRADYGSATSYGLERGGACEHPVPQPGMTNIGTANDDLAFGAFLRNGNGSLSSGRMAWLAVMTAKDRTGTAETCADTANQTGMFDHALP
jgi:hypothetical protein